VDRRGERAVRSSRRASFLNAKALAGPLSDLCRIKFGLLRPEREDFLPESRS